MIAAASFLWHCFMWALVGICFFSYLSTALVLTIPRETRKEIVDPDFSHSNKLAILCIVLLAITHVL